MRKKNEWDKIERSNEGTSLFYTLRLLLVSFQLDRFCSCHHLSFIHFLSSSLSLLFLFRSFIATVELTLYWTSTSVHSSVSHLLSISLPPFLARALHSLYFIPRSVFSTPSLDFHYQFFRLHIYSLSFAFLTHCFLFGAFFLRPIFNWRSLPTILCVNSSTSPP